MTSHTPKRSEDVTTTMYPTPCWYRNESSLQTSSDSATKVNLICDTLQTALSNIDETRYYYYYYYLQTTPI